MILVWAVVTLYRSPTAIKKMNNKTKSPSEMYNTEHNLQAWVFFFISWYTNLCVGYEHPFAAAFATFTLLIVTQGCQGGNGSGRCPCFQGKVLRHSSSFHLHLSHLSSSCNSIMQSSFPPYPGSWFPTHLSNLASAPFSFPLVPVWPS